MTTLHRLPELGVPDRAALDALLDSQWAGVLCCVADGEPLVVAPTTFESSVNYRSATVRGRLSPVEDLDAALDAFSEVLLPGRIGEVRRPSRKELAATQALSLPITEDNWLLKVADGWPATPEEAGADPGVWSGLVPVRTVLDPPVPAPWATDLPVPAAVRGLLERRSPSGTTDGPGAV